jgi:hypothetical protein
MVPAAGLLFAALVGIALVATSSKKKSGTPGPAQPGDDPCIGPAAGLIVALTNQTELTDAEKIDFFEDEGFMHSAAAVGGDPATFHFAVMADIREGKPADLEDYASLFEEAASQSDTPDAMHMAAACLRKVAQSKRSTGFGGHATRWR